MAAVASRYARALADVVLSRRLDPEAALAELADVVQLVAASPDLRKIWENPAIPAEQKRRLLDAIAARAGLSQPVRNFVAIIMDHRRLPMLGEIARQLRVELNQRLGITDAEVTSARELGDDEKKQLEAQIARALGRAVRAQYRTNPRLLGGAVVRIGSTVYDGSVHGQLQKLREELAEG